MMFTAIKADQVAQAWPLLSMDGMDKMLKYGCGIHSSDSIRDRCICGDWMLFVMFVEGQPVANIVAEIRQGPEQRILDVGFCWGGGVDEWIDEVYESFAQIARECGCSTIAFSGRPGWSRLAKRIGFEVQQMIFTKQVTA